MRGLRGEAGGGVDRVLGAVLVGGVALLAFAGPLLVEASPIRQDLARVLAPPSAQSLLGTDQLGRSVLARLVHAARLSVTLGAASVVAAAVPGVLLGLAAAWSGGWVDRVLSGVADAVLALPGLLLVLLVVAFAPGAMWPLFLGLSVAMWVEWFRVVRAASGAVLASPAVESARLLGFGPAHVLRRHVLPEMMPLLGTMAAFGLAATVLAIGALGFIGVGLRPPVAEWGVMMVELLPHYAEAPVALLAPAACLFTLVLGLQLLAGRAVR